MQARTGWALRSGAFALLFLLLWDTVLVRPFRVLVVLLHEIFHALAVLLTGGGVRTIHVLSARAGSTVMQGGVPAIVYPAGLLGTVLLGGILIAGGARYPLKRSLYLGLGLLIGGAALLFVRDPFGRAYGLLTAAVFVLLALRELPFSAHVADFLGVLCLVDAARDLAGFFLAPGRNDAMILHEITGVPYPAILAVWSAAILLLGGGGATIAWLSRAPRLLEHNPQWSDFRLVTRRAAMRRPQMTGYPESARGRRTVAVYLGVLAVLVLATLYSSRYVLFHPWTARTWVAGAAVAGRIYVAGGRDGQGDLFEAVHRIDPGGPSRSAQVRQVTALPSPRFGAAAAESGGLLYIAGGFDGKRCFDDLLVFDPGAQRLQRLASLPGPRAFGGLAALDGRLYYLGGWDGEAPTDGILAIDPRTGQAERIGRLPSARESPAVAALGGKLYCAGGSDSRGRYLDEILELDPRTGAVLRTGHLPSGRARIGAAGDADAAGAGSVYLAGGWDGSRMGEILRLRPGDGSGPLVVEGFARVTPGMSEAAAAVVGGRLYLLGGADARFQRQLRVVGIDPGSGRVEDVHLRSFLFW